MGLACEQRDSVERYEAIAVFPLMLITEGFLCSVLLKVCLSPALTGIGSLVSSDKERFQAGRNQPTDFYREHVTLYKTNLDVWFVNHNSLWLYFTAILVIARVVFSREQDG